MGFLEGCALSYPVVPACVAEMAGTLKAAVGLLCSTLAE